MKTLKPVFKAILTRYNLGESFINMICEFDSYPTDKELISFLNNCNDNDPDMNFETTIRVDKVYKVINNI